ncbi:MAG: DnaJ C-terminal domain-containing protein [Desulfobulbaceae bacterium]|jgi:curved DNA-binding protein|nr:DnaJ C-terminal domain-containing protein [Desulfobulbaceae bacterium]MDY0350614.1 DnaJ C-terminal domain-containing protein [Desulfobulbaceae bacterium]
MEYKDYYAILGVKRDATQDEIKKAYRRLARKYHPDVSKEADAESRFKDVGEAYEVLSDPEKKAAYDRIGSNWKAGQEFKPPPNWDAGFQFSGGGFSGADFGGFSDFFEELFGRGRFAGSRQRSAGFRMQGENQYAKIAIRLEDAYHGSKQTITLSRAVVDQNGHVRTEPHTLQVTIPKGITEGQHIRLEGQGMPGIGGGPSGDLYLEIAFAEHPLFQVKGRDIYYTLPVTPWEAALGATVTVPTLGGKVELKIPPNSQGGKKLRLKGRGLSTAARSGDQYVTLRIVVPEAKTEQQKKLYRDMARLMPVNPRK